MPAAARAPAPPATNCFLVRRTSGLLRIDPDETLDDPVQVPGHDPVGQAQMRYDVLADGVERAAALPGVEDVPRVSAAVHVVDLDVEPTDRRSLAGVVEAGPAVARRDGLFTGIA